MSFPFTIQLADGEEFNESVTKDHRLGQRAVTEDGRVFYYCRASSNGITNPHWAAASPGLTYNTTDLEDCVEGAVVTAQLAGSRTLDTLDSGTHAADFFADGFAVLTIGSKIQFHTIKSNTAAGTSTTLTLYQPLNVDVAADSQLQIFPSPYGEVDTHHGVTGPGSEAPFVCMPISTITASYYFWGQTWGPCYGIPSATFPKSTNEAALQFNSDGSITVEAARAANAYYQRAGHRFFRYSADPTGALLLFMLEIRP